MTTKISKVFLVLAVAAVIALPAAYAQSDVMIKADVPFDFTAGSQSYTAGNYILQTDMSTRVMTIRNTNTEDTNVLLAQPVIASKTPTEAKLIFHRYGDRYFLAQVWTPANDTGREFSPSKAEREMAANRVKRDTVEVAAVLR